MSEKEIIQSKIKELAEIIKGANYSMLLIATENKEGGEVTPVAVGNRKHLVEAIKLAQEIQDIAGLMKAGITITIKIKKHGSTNNKAQR